MQTRMRRNDGFDLLVAMDAAAIPQQHDWAREGVQQVAHKALDIRAFQATPAEVEVESNPTPLR